MPHVFQEDRDLMDLFFREAFEAMSEGVHLDTLYYPFFDNATRSNAFGSTRPQFDDPISIHAVCEFQRTEENQTFWGADEKVTGICMVRTKDAQFPDDHPNTRGEIECNVPQAVHEGGRARFPILAVHRERGIGHEDLITVLRLGKASHIKRTVQP